MLYLSYKLPFCSCILNKKERSILKMKKFDFKKHLSLIICAIAMFIASTSTSMCWVLLFGEPKMPESLYKKKES